MQTDYKFDFNVGLPGLLADNNQNKYVRSLLAEETLYFGRLLVKGTDLDRGAKLPAQETDVTTVAYLRGVAVRKEDIEANADGTVTVKSTDDIGGLRQGTIYVDIDPDAVITPSAAVYVRWATVAQVSTITFDVDFVSLNVINLKVNGTAISPVTFDTDQATTIAALATAIQGNADVVTAVAGTKLITITAASADTDVSVTDIVVTLGAAQAVGVFAETVTSKGTGTLGKFRHDSDSGAASVLPNSRWLTSANGSGNDLPQLEVNF